MCTLVQVCERVPATHASQGLLALQLQLLLLPSLFLGGHLDSIHHHGITTG